MSALEEHLVLPFSMQVTGSIALRGEGSQLRKDQVNLGGGKSQIPAGVGGYTNPFEDPYTFSNRYYKYRLDDGSYYSVPYLIHDRVSDNPTLHLQKKGLTEIRFILRNNDIEMEDRAVPVYPAEMMLDGRMPLEAIKKATAHKLVFVGLFGNYETKHQQAIDKFLTPVTPRMSGTLLLVNAWLNLAAGGQVRSNPIWLFFVFNFIVAAIMGFWYQNRKGRHWGAVLTLFINLTISLGIFPLIGLILYISFGIKLALGMSLLLFQYHYQFYIFITEKRKIHDPTK